MINDVKLIYITCGFLRLICSVLLTVCSHFKVNLSIGQFISFQKEQRLLPVFPLLNATVRIIEPLATTFRKELLSGRPEVQILSGTPKNAVDHFSDGLQRFCFSSRSSARQMRRKCLAVERPHFLDGAAAAFHLPLKNGAFSANPRPPAEEVCRLSHRGAAPSPPGTPHRRQYPHGGVPPPNSGYSSCHP